MPTMIISITTTIATAIIFQIRSKVKKSHWDLVGGSTFKKGLNNACEKIVHWKKNLFMLPSGAAGERYVEEVT